MKIYIGILNGIEEQAFAILPFLSVEWRAHRFDINVGFLFWGLNFSFTRSSW